MKKLFKLFLIAIAIFLAVWLASIGRCEYLSARYGHEFYGLDESTTSMLNKAENVKVLKYTDDYAEVFYFSEEVATHFYFHKTDGNWNMETWRCIWTNMGGNADEIIWPYWWIDKNWVK